VDAIAATRAAILMCVNDAGRTDHRDGMFVAQVKRQSTGYLHRVLSWPTGACSRTDEDFSQCFDGSRDTG
jgi:hypothetical protein